MSKRMFITLTTVRPNGKEIPMDVAADVIGAITVGMDDETAVRVDGQWQSVLETPQEVRRLMDMAHNASFV